MLSHKAALQCHLQISERAVVCFHQSKRGPELQLQPHHRIGKTTANVIVPTCYCGISLIGCMMDVIRPATCQTGTSMFWSDIAECTTPCACKHIPWRQCNLNKSLSASCTSMMGMLSTPLSGSIHHVCRCPKLHKGDCVTQHLCEGSQCSVIA